MIIKLNIQSQQKQTYYACNLSRKNYRKVMKIAERVHKIMGCRGVTRSDFKFYKNKFYLLEINTQPGMTSLSLVPEIAKYLILVLRVL